jgi:hypothetical protein
MPCLLGIKLNCVSEIVLKVGVFGNSEVAILAAIICYPCGQKKCEL